MIQQFRSGGCINAAPQQSHPTPDVASQLTSTSQSLQPAAELPDNKLQYQPKDSCAISLSSEALGLSASLSIQPNSRFRAGSRQVKKRTLPLDKFKPTKKLKDAMSSTPLGDLSKLPKELRQTLYRHVLLVEIPVILKRCYIRRVSERKRNRNAKDGDSQEKIGRFNVLRTSKQIYGEASWVLYSSSSLQFQVDRDTAPYLTGYSVKTVHHLGSVPREEKAKNMWKCAAKFRFVEIEIPEEELNQGIPTVYTARLTGIVSLLLKSWEDDSRPSNHRAARVVTIKLGSLFDRLVPFNASPAPDPLGDMYNWIHRNFPALDVNYKQIENESAANLRKLVTIIGNNRGSTNWIIVALEELKQSRKGGSRRLEAFKAICAKNGVRFKGDRG